MSTEINGFTCFPLQVLYGRADPTVNKEGSPVRDRNEKTRLKVDGCLGSQLDVDCHVVTGTCFNRLKSFFYNFNSIKTSIGDQTIFVSIRSLTERLLLDKNAIREVIEAKKDFYQFLSSSTQLARVILKNYEAIIKNFIINGNYLHTQGMNNTRLSCTFIMEVISTIIKNPNNTQVTDGAITIDGRNFLFKREGDNLQLTLMHEKEKEEEFFTILGVRGKIIGCLNLSTGKKEELKIISMKISSKFPQEVEIKTRELIKEALLFGYNNLRTALQLKDNNLRIDDSRKKWGLHIASTLFFDISQDLKSQTNEEIYAIQGSSINNCTKVLSHFYKIKAPSHILKSQLFGCHQLLYGLKKLIDVGLLHYHINPSNISYDEDGQGRSLFHIVDFSKTLITPRDNLKLDVNSWAKGSIPESNNEIRKELFERMKQHQENKAAILSQICELDEKRMVYSMGRTIQFIFYGEPEYQGSEPPHTINDLVGKMMNIYAGLTADEAFKQLEIILASQYPNYLKEIHEMKADYEKN